MLFAVAAICIIMKCGGILAAESDDGCTDNYGDFHKEGNSWTDIGGMFSWTCIRAGHAITVACITAAGKYIAKNHSLIIDGTKFTCYPNKDGILVLTEYDGCTDVEKRFHTYGEIWTENLRTLKVCAGANEITTVNCSCEPPWPRSTEVTQRITVETPSAQPPSLSSRLSSLLPSSLSPASTVTTVSSAPLPTATTSETKSTTLTPPPMTRPRTPPPSPPITKPTTLPPSSPPVEEECDCTWVCGANVLMGQGACNPEESAKLLNNLQTNMITETVPDFGQHFYWQQTNAEQYYAPQYLI